MLFQTQTISIIVYEPPSEDYIKKLYFRENYLEKFFSEKKKTKKTSFQEQQLILSRRFLTWKSTRNVLLKKTLFIIIDSMDPEIYYEECKYLFEITMLKLSK